MKGGREGKGGRRGPLQRLTEAEKKKIQEFCRRHPGMSRAQSASELATELRVPKPRVYDYLKPEVRAQAGQPWEAEHRSARSLAAAAAEIDSSSRSDTPRALPGLPDDTPRVHPALPHPPTPDTDTGSDHDDDAGRTAADSRDPRRPRKERKTKQLDPFRLVMDGTKEHVAATLRCAAALESLTAAVQSIGTLLLGVLNTAPPRRAPLDPAPLR